MTNNKTAFENIMNQTTEIALATCTKENPNVRIVNFYYQDNTVFFASSEGDVKIQEFAKNNRVSFTTIPKDSIAHIRVKAGLIEKSTKTIYDMAEEFSTKIPGYKENITINGDELVLFEIRFHEATLILDYDTARTIRI